MPTKTLVDVFEYLDYRAFLRDSYLERKESHGLSDRGFSKREGLKSPNYLKRVIDGERNLTDEMALRFAEALALDKVSKSYFSDLVRFNQARTASARNTHYGKLTGFRRYRKARPLELAHAAYHATWYLPAIREMACRPDFRDDPEWIAKELSPTISKSAAKDAMQTLYELGLLVKDKRGRVSLGDAVLSTGPETSGFHIANYHRTMMERAMESIELFGASDRDTSSLTLCLGEDGARKVKERIVRFRRELLELATLEDEPSQVVQINFQLFPLCKARGGADQ